VDEDVDPARFGASRRPLNTPFRLAPMIRSNISSSAAAIGDSVITPALLTSTSTPPKACSAASSNAALAKLDLRRRLALTLPQMYVATMLIARSDMIATLMADVVDASGYDDELAVLAPPIGLDPVLFLLFWHCRNGAHLAQRWLLNTIAALFVDGSAPEA
jgi:hypothetical protein